MKSITNVIMSQKNTHNGHFMMTISGLSIEQGLEIIKDLENNYGGHEGFLGSYVVEVYSDRTYSIVQKDFWKPGQHPLGHLDRLLLNVEE